MGFMSQRHERKLDDQRRSAGECAGPEGALTTSLLVLERFGAVSQARRRIRNSRNEGNDLMWLAEAEIARDGEAGGQGVGDGHRDISHVTSRDPYPSPTGSSAACGPARTRRG